MPKHADFFTEFNLFLEVILAGEQAGCSVRYSSQSKQKPHANVRIWHILSLLLFRSFLPCFLSKRIPLCWLYSTGVEGQRHYDLRESVECLNVVRE